MLFNSAMSAEMGGFDVALYDIVRRYRFPPLVSHVYSMYARLPSLLMSPMTFMTDPVEPFVNVDPFALSLGTTPYANPPATDIGAFARWDIWKFAVNVLFEGSTAVTVVVSICVPVSTTSRSPTN